MKSEIRGKKLLLEFELQQPRLSASGKSYVVASSKGPRRARGNLSGSPVFVVASAIVYLDDATTAIERAAAPVKKSAHRGSEARREKTQRDISTGKRGNRHEG